MPTHVVCFLYHTVLHRIYHIINHIIQFATQFPKSAFWVTKHLCVTVCHVKSPQPCTALSTSSDTHNKRNFRVAHPVLVTRASAYVQEASQVIKMILVTDQLTRDLVMWRVRAVLEPADSVCLLNSMPQHINTFFLHLVKLLCSVTCK